MNTDSNVKKTRSFQLRSWLLLSKLIKFPFFVSVTLAKFSQSVNELFLNCETRPLKI